MFGVGLPELVVILVIALIVLGPKRLPEVARTLGKAMGEFRRQSADILEEFQHEARLDDDATLRRRPAPPARTPVPAGAVARTPAADAEAAAAPATADAGGTPRAADATDVAGSSDAGSRGRA